MIRLSAKWTNELAAQPETGVGYQVATVLLRDGRKVEQVVIAEGLITQVRGLHGIPFVEEEIDQIKVTHDKWDFKTETR